MNCVRVGELKKKQGSEAILHKDAALIFLIKAALIKEKLSLLFAQSILLFKKMLKESSKPFASSLKRVLLVIGKK